MRVAGDHIEAETTGGPILGGVHDGVAIFRGIRYGAPPVGPRRFHPAEAAAPWDQPFDARSTPPAAPQPRRTLDDVRGSDDFDISEDCLTVSVWAPATNEGTALPVMVWIHGGGFIAGGPDWARYDARRLAQSGRVVVVAIGYRLGVLGFLHAPALFPDTFDFGNLSLRDQILGLQWVKDNVAEFGGDSNSVTVFGQSGGAGSIAAIMASKEGAGLFHRAIIQSGALAPPQTVEAAAAVAATFIAALDVEVTRPEDLYSLPVAQILLAQARLISGHQRFGDYYPPFQFVDDGTLFDTPWLKAIDQGWATTVDVMAGSTKDDGKVAFARLPDSHQVTLGQIVDRFWPITGEQSEAVVDAYRRARPTEHPSELMGTIVAECWSRIPGIRLAETAQRHGRAAYVYEFEWESRDRGIAACHGIDVPFVFGNLENWSTAQMMRGCDSSEVQAISKVAREAWISFAVMGNPDALTGNGWRPYEPLNRWTMRLGPTVDCVSDYSGRTREILDNALPAVWP